jgi:hypothetical protein
MGSAPMSVTPRFRAALGGVALLAVAAATATALWRSSPAAEIANLWVDGGDGACRRSGGGAAYDRASACGDLGAAYARARPGDLVLIRGGRYGGNGFAHYPRSHVIDVDPSKTRAERNVTLRSAAGQRVSFAGDLVVRGSHLWLGGTSRSPLRIAGALIVHGTRGVDNGNHMTFERMRMRAFAVGPAEHVLLRHLDVGPNELACGGDGIEPRIDGTNVKDSREAFTAIPADITLERVRIHGQQSADLGCQHVGGMQINAADRLVIRDSVFERNMVYDIQADAGSHVDVEDNVFGVPVDRDGRTPIGQPELQFRGAAPYVDWQIRGNRFHNGIGLDFNGTSRHTDTRVVGNVARTVDCGVPNVTYERNRWADADC